MQDIDFLPIQYRREHVRRQAQPWRIIVAAGFVLLLAAAAFTQHRREQATAEQLQRIMPQYELAVRQRSQLAELQARLQQVRARAELITYLRHTWPRTQLLAALLQPLPDEVTFRQLQVLRRDPPQRVADERRSRPGRKADDRPNEKLPPATRDLKRLRQQCDRAQTVVLLSGTTVESAALHDYLGKLHNAKLFSKAELDSIESPEDGQGVAQQFGATLVVRPGYGQPDGPQNPAEEVAR